MVARKLLAVLSHPDDESFGPGGTLSLYAQQGVEVHLITVTGGEVGTVDASHLEGHASISELRKTELDCAAAALGLDEVHLLGYRDSGMPGTPDNEHPRSLVAAPLEKVTAEIEALIAAIQPQIVITHDPIGDYRHPDHIATHKATRAAFERTVEALAEGGAPAYTPRKLYYHTFPRRYLRFLIWFLPLLGRNPRKWGRNRDIDLLDLASEEFPIHARISYRSVMDRKKRATACHASQLDGGPPSTSTVLRIIRFLDRDDHYIRAYPRPNPGRIESDLFEGVADG